MLNAFFKYFVFTGMSFGIFLSSAQAFTSIYPGIRYMSSYSESIGGITLPISDEVGNSLFNNPAGLAKNAKFRAEPIDLYFDANSVVLGSLGLSTLKMTGLGKMTTTLNSDINKVYSAAFGDLTAFSWGGLGVGFLYQQRVRAYSDGTNVHYQTVDEFVPAVGYGLSLARGVIKVGYSLQFINLASGNTTALSNSSASYVQGIQQGHAFSNTLSGSILFPFTYTPSVSIIGRNLGNVVYGGSSLVTSAKNSIGSPGTERMSVDMALNFTVRITGSLRTLWLFEYDDATSSVKMPFLEKLRAGLDLQLTRAFGIRAGFNGSQFSGGIGLKSPSTEINLAMYSERSPFANLQYWDRRYSLQYKVYFQDKNTRSRDEGKPNN